MLLRSGTKYFKDESFGTPSRKKLRSKDKSKEVKKQRKSLPVDSKDSLVESHIRPENLRHLDIYGVDALYGFSLHPELLGDTIDVAVTFPTDFTPPSHPTIKWQRITYLPMTTIAWSAIISYSKN